MIASTADRLPDFPEHYNEDYVWLHALKRAGWPLQRVEPLLAHTPPRDYAAAAPALSFQIFGEIVWFAVLERERFPLTFPSALAAAIDEIVGDVLDVIAHADASRLQTMAAMKRK